MSAGDDLREFLRARAAPDFVVEGGLEGLIEQWQRVVQSVEEGYDGTLDDWLNDLDGRQLLHEALAAVPGVANKPRRERIAALDERMRSVTALRARCLWGDQLARRSAWTRDTHWWYWAAPKAPGEDLAADLAP